MRSRSFTFNNSFLYCLFAAVLVTFASPRILQNLKQRVRMKSYIKLFELMKHNEKKYNETVRFANLNHKTIEKVLQKHYSYKFYS
jgi:low affinity Fe/Cu permease